jgi:integrase
MIDPKKDLRRRCLKVEDWPEADRREWERIRRRGDVLDDAGAAGHWAPDTLHKNRRGYGRWLTFCAHHTGLDPLVPPAERVEQTAIGAYVAELRSFGNSPYTVRNRIGELLAVIRAFAPDRDWSWLKRLYRRLELEAHPVQPKGSTSVSAADLYAWSLTEMDAAEGHPRWTPIQRAVRYRMGLMVALLSLCPALRRKNLAAVVIGRHLLRASDGYRLRFAASEMKARRPHAEPVSVELTERLDRYIGHHRAVLLGGRESDRLWISYAGRPMTEMSIYHRLTKVTGHAFGVALSPHDFRYVAGDTMAIHDPQHVRVVAPVLGHATFKTTEGHYIQAHSLEASRRIGAGIRRLRKRLR